MAKGIGTKARTSKRAPQPRTAALAKRHTEPKRSPTRKPATSASTSKSLPASASKDHPLSLPKDLDSLTKRELAKLAKLRGVKGWHGMSKNEILAALRGGTSALTRVVSRPETPSAPIKAAARRTHHPAPERPRLGVRIPGDLTKDISRVNSRNPAEIERDRLVLMVRDPYWLHVFWEITRQTFLRTEAALGNDWYTAKPVLRLVDVTSEDTTNASESVVRDIPIHGGVNNWYIDLTRTERSYRVDIGYLTTKGRFFTVARSNVVTTPKAGVSDQLDEHWRSVREEYERIYALSGGHETSHVHNELKSLFEERLRRPMNSGSLSDYGSGALGEDRLHGFHFELDAELIVYGSTVPGAHVTLQGEPVQVREDGSFTLRYCLPDGRQILPAVAQTPDGLEERTIILAIERNTKQLEPMIHDGQD